MFKFFTKTPQFLPLAFTLFWSSSCYSQSEQSNAFDQKLRDIAKHHIASISPEILNMDTVEINVLKQSDNIVYVSVVGIDLHKNVVPDTNGEDVETTTASGQGMEIYIDMETHKVIKAIASQ